MWEKTYGGAGEDHGWAMPSVEDGGYIIAGETDSFGAGELDAYLIRVGEDGEELWTRTHGSDQDDRVFSVRQTPDTDSSRPGSLLASAPQTAMHS